MSIKALDALSLAVLDDDAKIARIAAIWCRAMGDLTPSSRQYLARWVKREYGPILDKEHIEPLTVRLLDEIKHQVRLRARRKRAKEEHDALAPKDRHARVARVLFNALGPARAWVSRSRMGTEEGEYRYISAKVHSGLVAGIVPVTMNLSGARIVNPNLLVYRERGHDPKSFWIPGRICEVEDALVWLAPKAVQELVTAFHGPDLEVEHDYERQACRVTTPYGTKLIPWRGLHD